MSGTSWTAKAPARYLSLGGRYEEVKDPCPVRLGRRWHLFGTGITGPGRFEVLHATSDELGGPWTLEASPHLPSLQGGCVAAPGVIAEDGLLHMFLQSDFNVLDGRVERLVSCDAGRSFTHLGTALRSIPASPEAGVYDPHPAAIDQELYLTYSAFGVVGSPDIHLARSTSGSWNGPWERLGAILRHEDVPFHNPRGCAGYEWGLEGAQLLQLGDGTVLLSAVCFLTAGSAGSRQRVLLGVADSAQGPFELLGTLTPPASRGENGHACAVLDGDELFVCMQERSGAGSPWRYALERVPLARVLGARELRAAA